MNLVLQTIASPVISELLAESHLDGIVIDTEHGCFNNETLLSCIQVITLMNKKCFVRVTYLEKRLVRMCLDAGVDGLIFSTVNTGMEAADIIEYCNYPTHRGIRGQGLVRENKWDKKLLSHRKPILIAQIETKTAVDNLDDLLAYDFDMFVIGPYDLSSSLNCTGDWNNLDYLNYINIIYNKIPNAKLGSFITTKQDIDEFNNSQKIRPNLVIWGMDADFIKQGVQNIKV
jgi:4-hydroxy-2-oxoheptanedioate aldolase